MRSKAKVVDGQHQTPRQALAVDLSGAPEVPGSLEPDRLGGQQDPVAPGSGWTTVELPFEGVVKNPGKAALAPFFFTPGEAAAHFTELRDSLCWEERAIQIFGRRLLQPRLVAYYGDPGASY